LVDIKDFILIVGGALIVAVIAHGFWTAWRSQREPLKIEIKPELIPDETDEMDRFRGELPNGGARPKSPDQGSFELEVTAGPEPVAPAQTPSVQGASSAMKDAAVQAAADRELLGADEAPAIARRAERSRARPKPRGPDLFTIPEGFGPDEDDMAAAAAVAPPTESSEPPAAPAATTDPVSGSDKAAQPIEPTIAQSSAEPKRPRVAEVELPAEPAVADGEADALQSENRRELRPRRTSPAGGSTRSTHKPRRLGTLRSAANDPLPEREARKPDHQATAAEAAPKEPVEALMLIHLVAPQGQTFAGDALCDALREKGLKFGTMNIFHRVDPLTKGSVYSVANAVEPGFFDLSDLSKMTTPGVTFFLQLPGPENPSAAMEDMLDVAQAVAHKLGGELRDEAKNRLTRQAASHMQQQVSDFALKHMSRKAL
jgi:cell division protein ZipA